MRQSLQTRLGHRRGDRPHPARNRCGRPGLGVCGGGTDDVSAERRTKSTGLGTRKQNEGPRTATNHGCDTTKNEIENGVEGNAAGAPGADAGELG
eukprot:scaffold15380_cov117-Isochrysis_galbana.AAC.5